MVLSVFLQTRAQVETDGSLRVKGLLQRAARVRAPLCRTRQDPWTVAAQLQGIDIALPGAVCFGPTEQWFQIPICILTLFHLL